MDDVDVAILEEVANSEHRDQWIVEVEFQAVEHDHC